MNNLLFTTLIIVLLYYFFAYLPQQKKLTTANPPLKHHQFTQTESDPIIETTLQQTITNLEQEKSTLLKDIQQKERTITGLNNSYNKLETEKDKKITDLQTQIRDLVKRPLKPTNSKGTQTDELTNTLDTLIKDIQEMNNYLD